MISLTSMSRMRATVSHAGIADMLRRPNASHDSVPLAVVASDTRAVSASWAGVNGHGPDQ